MFNVASAHSARQSAKSIPPTTSPILPVPPPTAAGTAAPPPPPPAAINKSFTMALRDREDERGKNTSSNLPMLWRPTDGGAQMVAAVSDERHFFQRFAASHEEIKRLKEQCRAASEAYVAGTPKDGHVNLHHVKRSIAAAKETAKYSVDVLSPEDSGDPARFNAASKAWLGHLYIPSVKDRYRELEQEAAAEMCLPGATEAIFSARTEEDQQREFSPEQASDPLSPGITAKNPFACDDDDGGLDSDSDDSNDQEFDKNSLEGMRRHSGAGMSQQSGSEACTPDSEENKWRARPPMTRFKTRLQFSQIFKSMKQGENPAADRASVRQAIEDAAVPDVKDLVLQKANSAMTDPMIGWINNVFGMTIETEYQFEIGFPLIVLTVLDAIYPKRVRWHKVDWRIQYKRALENNYLVLERIWSEVNMEKSREFRFEQTSIRLEHMSRANMVQKLEFVRLLKRWFDQRIHHAGPYDPIKKRREMVENSRLKGLPVTFPPWMKACRAASPTEIRKQSTQMGFYRALPEFKRFIWFLGSPEHQTM